MRPRHGLLEATARARSHRGNRAVYWDIVPDSVEARLAAYFERHPRGIAAVYLFGSTARGTAGPDSASI
jgi:hypothetical protein